MMINFTVICLQPTCRDYRAQVNYVLSMKLTISCLNTCFRVRKFNKRMSKLLQEINLQVLRQPNRHPCRQTGQYIINRINNRRINNMQYRQNNFQISTVIKHKKAMWTESQLLQAFLTLSWRRPLSYRNQSICLQTKSMDRFLYDNGLRHEKVNNDFSSNPIMPGDLFKRLRENDEC